VSDQGAEAGARGQLDRMAEVAALKAPSTNVPLRLPRSRMRAHLSLMESSQWKRDTVGSAMTRSHDGAEPMVQRPAANSRCVERAGPSITSSEKPQTSSGPNV
jgi:hypothetical protein